MHQAGRSSLRLLQTCDCMTRFVNCHGSLVIFAPWNGNGQTNRRGKCHLVVLSLVGFNPSGKKNTIMTQQLTPNRIQKTARNFIPASRNEGVRKNIETTKRRCNRTCVCVRACVWGPYSVFPSCVISLILSESKFVSEATKKKSNNLPLALVSWTYMTEDEI